MTSTPPEERGCDLCDRFFGTEEPDDSGGLLESHHAALAALREENEWQRGEIQRLCRGWVNARKQGLHSGVCDCEECSSLMPPHVARRALDHDTVSSATAGTGTDLRDAEVSPEGKHDPEPAPKADGGANP